MSALYGSLCFRFDNCLSCFLNVLQSKSNHFSTFCVFLVYFLPFSIHLYMLLFKYVFFFSFVAELTPSLVVSNVLFINIVNRFFSSSEFSAWGNLSALSEVHLYLCWT